jgi:CheY-like chemotaxis protein
MVPPSEAVTGPRRVLVIDDNDDMRATLRMQLQLDGHQVDEAADGVRGLEMLLHLRPDVTFIEWKAQPRKRTGGATGGLRPA